MSNFDGFSDGLDELGAMSKGDVSNAARAAAHPSLAVDMRTLCAGILSKTILPGAKVLATGRSTEVINRDILEGKALLYEFVGLTDEDRTKLIDMMEQNKGEQERIQKELDRVATDNNEFFMKTPLMVRMIITLIIDKKVTIESAKNSSEIYLMLLLSRAVKTIHKDFFHFENCFLCILIYRPCQNVFFFMLYLHMGCIALEVHNLEKWYFFVTLTGYCRQVFKIITLNHYFF